MTKKSVLFDSTKALMAVMNLPERLGLVDVIRTSDGCYLGMAAGDIGYNAFLGKPASIHPGPGLENATEKWNALSKSEQLLVAQLARAKSILLTEFLPEEVLLAKHPKIEKGD